MEIVAALEAFIKRGRLHRDISIGNIVLVRKNGEIRRIGFLIDWELSCSTGKNRSARDYARSVRVHLLLLLKVTYTTAGDLGVHVYKSP